MTNFHSTTICDRSVEEFEKWWFKTVGLNTEFPRNPIEIAKITWNAAWCSAKLGQLDRAKAEVLSEVKAILFADATSAFLDGDDAEAMLLRRIANNLG